MFLLGLLHFYHDFSIFLAVIECRSLHAAHIIVLRLVRVLRPLNFVLLIVEILFELIPQLVDLVGLFIDRLGLVLDLHEAPGVVIVILLELLQLSSFLEQSLTGGSALVFEYLLLVEVCSLGALHELVPVVLVAHLEVVERVRQRLDLLLALADLPVQLVPVPLQLLLLLGRLDHVVGLGVLADGLHFPTARLTLLD